MPELKGLAGMKASSIECKFFNKPSDVKKILDEGLAATTAGNNGAINVWKDDEGNIRCERQAWCVVQDGAVFKSYRGVSSWCKSALAEIN